MTAGRPANYPSWFAAHGIRVFPLVGKVPVRDCHWNAPDYYCSVAEAATFRNYGIRLGDRLAVVDTDSAATEAWVAASMPPTPFQVFTTRGRHRYFRHDGPAPAYIHRDGHAIEFRHGPSYVVGPGSIHPSGAVYTPSEWSWRWDDLPHFPTDFSWDDRPPSLHSGYTLPEAWYESERHHGLYRLMRSLVARGVPLDGALAACAIENQHRCRPPLTDLRDLNAYLRRAFYQSDRRGFTRTPTTGWELAGGLVELGLSVEATLVAVRSVTPDFDPLA